MHVLKIGGSILTDAEAYARVAERLARLPGPRCVVVSAAHGVTDRLAAQEAPARLWADHVFLAGGDLPSRLRSRLERAAQQAADGRTGALLAWGEQASAEILRCHLRREGVHPPILELGARAPRHRGLVIVPGFYRRDGPLVRVLGRGGSDISAVELAAEVGARQVTYWKDGGGIHEGGRVLATAGAAWLIQRIGDAIRPVHPEAVRRAAAEGIQLVLEDPWGAYASTVVG